MKKKFLSALLIASIILTGCSTAKTTKNTRATTDDDIETTEETSERERDTVEESESATETTEFVDSRPRESVEDGSVSILLDGMTAEEIIATFDQMTKVYDGDTMEDYLKRFSMPATSSELDGASFLYTDNTDYIVSVWLNGAGIKSSDGTITIKKKTELIITFYLSDTELAKELYDKLIEHYSVRDLVEDVRKDENRWYSGDMYFKIQMSTKNDGRAGITVTIPLNPPAKT